MEATFPWTSPRPRRRTVCPTTDARPSTRACRTRRVITAITAVKVTTSRNRCAGSGLLRERRSRCVDARAAPPRAAREAHRIVVITTPARVITIIEAVVALRAAAHHDIHAGSRLVMRIAIRGVAALLALEGVTEMRSDRSKQRRCRTRRWKRDCGRCAKTRRRRRASEAGGWRKTSATTKRSQRRWRPYSYRSCSVAC